MKTLLIALLMSSTLLINTEVQAAPPAKKVNTILNKIMSYPDFARKLKSSGIVYVSFETCEDGTVEILKLNASSKKFGDYVTKKLGTLEFDEDETNKVYNYKFTFKPEKR